MLRLFKSTTLVVVLILVAQSASAERKALVIGNAGYTDKPLTNPTHDAEDMAGKLDALGFTVAKVNDADKRQFIDSLEAFRASLNPDDDAVIYYAGHGAQFAGLNYLEPLNAAIHRDEDLETEAVELKRVLNALNPVRNGLKLVIIDACRNNPYPGKGRSGTSGLAEVGKKNIPNQTLLWFAASPGEEANDGRGRNSPFTEQLLRNLDKPGLKAEDVFKQVSRAVIAATQNADKPQHPYPEGQTLVDFCFANCSKATELQAEEELRKAKDGVESLEVSQHQPVNIKELINKLDQLDSNQKAIPSDQMEPSTIEKIQTPESTAKTSMVLIQKYLPKQLWDVARKFEIPESFLSNSDMSALIQLILRTESMDSDERQDWLNKLPDMTDEQISRLFNILETERKKLLELDLKYQLEIQKLNEKHLLEWKNVENKKNK